MLSYEARVARIKTAEDVGKQLQRAINVEKKIRGEMRSELNFSKKIELKRELGEATKIVSKLRCNMFDLESSVEARLLQQEKEKVDAIKSAFKASNSVFAF